MAFLAVLALSVSIGMTTQTFSVLNGILFKGLPFPEADRLFTIYRTASGKVGEELAIPRQDLSRLTGQLDCFESMSGMYAGTINLSGDGLPMRYTGTFVSANILETLGVGTQLGQGFSRDGRDGTHGQLLISDRVWRDRYRGDPGILNQVVRVNGEERSIAGIMPEGFHFPVRHLDSAGDGQPAHHPRQGSGP